MCGLTTAAVIPLQFLAMHVRSAYAVGTTVQSYDHANWKIMQHGVPVAMLKIIRRSVTSGV